MQDQQDWQKIELRYAIPDYPDISSVQEAFWGVAEQSDGSWVIAVNCPGGFLSADQVAVLADITSDKGLGIKLTGRQAPFLVVPKDKVGPALAKLKSSGQKVTFIHGSLRNVKACLGSRGCKNSRSYDAIKIAQEIDRRFYGVILPWDFKIGISGCTRNCASAACQSLGLVERCNGFDVYLGGSERLEHDAPGKLVAQEVPEAKIADVLAAVLKIYIWESEELKKKGHRGHIRFQEVFANVGKALFVNAINETLDRKSEPLPGITPPPPIEAQNDTLPGFNKENVFNAFVTLNKLCLHCNVCLKYKCHLFIAKETLSEATRTGKKFLPGIPSDMLQLIRSLPLPVDKFEMFKLYDAYHDIVEMCDQCQISDHDPLCAVNLAATAVGCISNGQNYLTLRDREKQTPTI